MKGLKSSFLDENLVVLASMSNEYLYDITKNQIVAKLARAS